MPDLDLIKQGEQGVRDRRGRFARGLSGNPADRPRGCRDHVNRAARLLLACARVRAKITAPCLTKRYPRLKLTIYGQTLLEDVLGTTVSVAQAKSQFAALVARAEAGERIVVTRSGRAVACLGPLPRRQPIRYGELRGVFLSEDLTIPEEVIRDFEPSE
jgi:prevent-host-death family protein